MRVYFLSRERAALKLDGAYAGTCDMFEQFAELDERRGILAELVPGGNRQPLNFFIDKDFFEHPHDYAAVAVAEHARYIYADEFKEKSDGISVLAQKRAGGSLVTVFRQGGIFVAADGADCAVMPLPTQFRDAKIDVCDAAGNTIAAISAGDRLALLCGADMFFCGRAENYECGADIAVTVPLGGCAGLKATLTFEAAEGTFKECRRTVAATRAPADGTEHIAFFEGVLHGADCTTMLDDGISGRADALKDYLGEFVAVIPPDGYICQKYGKRTAGLVYRRQGRLYDIKYFAAEMKDGKIANILPVCQQD